MKIFIVAGESSGDRLGADLMRGLRKAVPGVEFQGVAGPEMQVQGVDSLFDMSELSVMGLVEILPKYLGLKRRLAQAVGAVLIWKPDVLIQLTHQLKQFITWRLRFGPGAQNGRVKCHSSSIMSWRCFRLSLPTWKWKE